MTGIFLVCLASFHAKAQQQAPSYLAHISLTQQTSYPSLNTVTQSHPLAGFAYWSYKRFISSQDGDHCPFEVSCSHYAIQSVNRYGVFPGALSGIDRLQRCNGLGVRKYPVNPRTGKRIDPLE